MPVGLVDFIQILSCPFTFLGYRNNPLLPHTNPHSLKVYSADGQLGLPVISVGCTTVESWSESAARKILWVICNKARGSSGNETRIFLLTTWRLVMGMTHFTRLLYL